MASIFYVSENCNRRRSDDFRLGATHRNKTSSPSKKIGRVRGSKGKNVKFTKLKGKTAAPKATPKATKKTLKRK